MAYITGKEFQSMDKDFLKWQLFKMKNSLKEFLADGVKISNLTEANWNAFF